MRLFHSPSVGRLFLSLSISPYLAISFVWSLCHSVFVYCLTNLLKWSRVVIIDIHSSEWHFHFDSTLFCILISLYCFVNVVLTIFTHFLCLRCFGITSVDSVSFVPAAAGYTILPICSGNCCLCICMLLPLSPVLVIRVSLSCVSFNFANIHSK